MLVGRQGGAAAPKAKAAPIVTKDNTSGERLNGREMRRRAAAEKEAKMGKIQLATEPSKPIRMLGEATILLHGERKIGKTSLASMFPGSYFLFFEPGGKGLSVRSSLVESWEEFRRYVDLIIEDDTIQTPILDTAGVAYDMCYEYICDQNGVESPNDADDFGTTWRAIASEFKDQINRLIRAGKGPIFICHTAEKDFRNRAGTANYQKLMPELSKGARKFLVSESDVIAYYGYWGEERWLTIRGSDELEAGNRLKKCFRTPEGKKLHSIPMFEDGNEEFDEEQAYANLVTAFENRQAFVGRPDGDPALSERPAVREKKRK